MKQQEDEKDLIEMERWFYKRALCALASRKLLVEKFNEMFDVLHRLSDVTCGFSQDHLTYLQASTTLEILKEGFATIAAIDNQVDYKTALTMIDLRDSPLPEKVTIQ